MLNLRVAVLFTGGCRTDLEDFGWLRLAVRFSSSSCRGLRVALVTRVEPRFRASPLERSRRGVLVTVRTVIAAYAVFVVRAASDTGADGS